MKLAEAVAPHLPLLRRYARALSGSQSGGDSYVRVCLEALVTDPTEFDVSLAPKTALYQLFHRVWSQIGQETVAVTVASTADTLAADERLKLLTPRSRQALLLSAMEGFSNDQASAILDIDEDEFAQLLKIAEKEIEDAIRARVLIIEDEPVIALDIQGLVEEMGHSVTGVTTTKTDAIAAAKANAPDLVLADIQLADGSSGVDAASEILKQLQVPVIFITAFPERLLTGRRVEPTFLITKPFVPAAVRAAISQALFFKSNARRLEP